MRALPSAFTEDASAEWIFSNTTSIFRALFISYTSVARPVKNHKLSATAASSALFTAAMSGDPEALFASATRALVSAFETSNKAERVDAALRSIAAIESLLVSRVSVDGLFKANIELGIASDRAFLEAKEYRNSAAMQLIHQRSFMIRDEAAWRSSYSKATRNIVAVDPAFAIWTDWLDNVIDGKTFNFVSPQGGSMQLDYDISRAIVQTKAIEFWDRTPQEVKSSIDSWKSGKIAPETTTASRAIVPLQNPNALSFSATSSGQIFVDQFRDVDLLRDDQDARDRYAECVSLAVDVLERCKVSNAAARLTGMLQKYIESAGNSPHEIQPSLFVQRGERIRQEIETYATGDSLLPPVSDDTFNDLKGWRASHNMFVGLDPILMSRDTAQLGPDHMPPLIYPDEIRELAKRADDEGLLVEAVSDIIIEAANLAPREPNLNNRRTVWSIETARNLIIEAFSVAFRRPIATSVAILATGVVVNTAGASATVLAGAAGLVPAARFLLKHRAWIEDRLGNSPTWNSLFGDLADWVKENTPLDHNETED